MITIRIHILNDTESGNEEYINQIRNGEKRKKEEGSYRNPSVNMENLKCQKDFEEEKFFEEVQEQGN
jgi:hypothetical protein